MSAREHPQAMRVFSTLVVAILCGAFVGNIVAGDLLDLSTPVRTVLWIVAAVLGGLAQWSEGPQRTSAQGGTVGGIAIVLLCAVTAVVLLPEPANLYVGGAVLLGGAGVFVALKRGQ